MRTRPDRERLDSLYAILTKSTDVLDEVTWPIAKRLIEEDDKLQAGRSGDIDLAYLIGIEERCGHFIGSTLLSWVLYLREQAETAGAN